MGQVMAGKTYAVRVSHLPEGENRRIAAFMQRIIKDDRFTTLRDEAIGTVPDIAKSAYLVNVSGYKGVAPYVRAAPGAKRLVDTLGKQSFDLFGCLLGVGLQAYEDLPRADLNANQKLFRASLALLGSAVPPLGLTMAAAALLFPQQYDQLTAMAATDQNPAVQWLANQIVRVGGSSFQQWSTQPSVIDLF
jgi:hypothetical protein